MPISTHDPVVRTGTKHEAYQEKPTVSHLGSTGAAVHAAIGTKADSRTCRLSGLSAIEAEDVLDWLTAQRIVFIQVCETPGQGYVVEWPRV